MRILNFTEGYLPEVSGVTVSLHQRLSHWSRGGHEALVVAPDYRESGALYPDWAAHVGQVMPGVTVVPVPSAVFFNYPYTRTPRPFRFDLERTLAENRFAPDVVVVDCPERLWSGYLRRPGLAWARRRNVPLVGVYHTNYLAYAELHRARNRILGVPGMRRLLTRLAVWILNSYPQVLVASTPTREYLEGLGVRGVELARFYGVDTRVFDPARRGRERSTGEIRLLYVGRLSAEKFVDFLVTTLPTLRARSPHAQITLDVIGRGPEDDHLRALAVGVGGVRFHGGFGEGARAALAQAFADADVFVSAGDRETFGLTALEAMASGLAQVWPNAGGVTALVRSGVHGVLYRPGDRDDYVRAVTELIGDPDRRLRMGRAARSDALAWEWSEVLEDFTERLRAVRRPSPGEAATPTARDGRSPRREGPAAGAPPPSE